MGTPKSIKIYNLVRGIISKEKLEWARKAQSKYSLHNIICHHIAKAQKTIRFTRKFTKWHKEMEENSESIILWKRFSSKNTT